MNKFTLGTTSLLIAVSLLGAGEDANAANKAISLTVDGVTLKADAAPVFHNNRAMVPLRVLSENLGANVSWSKSEVIVSSETLTIRLQIGNKEAKKNGETIALDASPYVQNSRVYVPLRLIAEAFGCTVSFTNGDVSVSTKPFVLHGKTVYSLQSEYQLGGTLVQALKSPLYMAAYYAYIESGKQEQVEAPAHIGTNPLEMERDWAYKIYKIAFYDQEEQLIQQYDSYGLYMDDETVLLHDVTADHWFVFIEEENENLLTTLGNAEANGYWATLQNTFN